MFRNSFLSGLAFPKMTKTTTTTTNKTSFETSCSVDVATKLTLKSGTTDSITEPNTPTADDEPTMTISSCDTAMCMNDKPHRSDTQIPSQREDSLKPSFITQGSDREIQERRYQQTQKKGTNSFEHDLEMDNSQYHDKEQKQVHTVHPVCTSYSQLSHPQKYRQNHRRIRSTPSTGMKSRARYTNHSQGYRNKMHLIPPSSLPSNYTLTNMPSLTPTTSTSTMLPKPRYFSRSHSLQSHRNYGALLENISEDHALVFTSNSSSTESASSFFFPRSYHGCEEKSEQQYPQKHSNLENDSKSSSRKNQAAILFKTLPSFTSSSSSRRNSITSQDDSLEGDQRSDISNGLESLRKVYRRQRAIENYMDNIKGVEQSIACRDLFCAILFILHVCIIIILGIKYGSLALMADGNHGRAFNNTIPNGKELFTGNEWVMESANGTEIVITYRNVIILAFCCGAFSVGISTLSIIFMAAFSKRLIQVALCFAIGLGFTWGIIGIGLASKNFVPITGIFALGLSIAYTFVVWDRIPFASVNLKVALSALKGKWDVIAFTFAMQAVFLVWSIFFTYTSIGLYDAFTDHVILITKRMRWFCYLGLILSFFWTFQVCIHVVQVAVAGVISEWWFQKECTRYLSCSQPFATSFLRAIVFSFGSVCFGSLIVGFMQILRQVAGYFRPKCELWSSCCHDCFATFQHFTTSRIDDIGSIFHQWAFTYIGIYGYPFIEAGRNASLLFKKRGWCSIVTDDLIPNVLLMVSLVIGGATGCFAVLLESTEGSELISLSNPSATAFTIGVCVGTALSSILFSIINSSVNAVVVCFAGSPVEFEQNHKQLSHEMRSAWRQVWPGSVDFVHCPRIRMSSHLRVDHVLLPGDDPEQ